MNGKLKCSAFVPFALVIVLQVSISDAFDAEFGQIITYDNFDHFKVSVKRENDASMSMFMFIELPSYNCSVHTSN